MSTERRLAAILAADVVGFSRLMEADEAGALAALKAHRAEFIDPAIAARGGRIVKLMGDGALIEFASVVDAVESAVEVQRGMAKRNAGAPDGQGIVFRIGINLGDVIIDGDDIYGDGVNIAARLEALAEPGGICISGAVHEHIAGKVDHGFEDGGAQTVKNIARPIRVWMWSEGEAVTRPDAASPALPDKPSVAVLPFNNMSADADQEFFADGICEDIITELSKYRSLFVTARNSSFSFKGQALEIKEIGQKLGVRYVVEGSVRRAGDRVRITAQLIDAPADNHLWAERYDRDLEDIFAVQDEVTHAVVTAIAPTLSSAERERARRKPAESLDAWETYQRGMWHVYRNVAEDNVEAQSCFKRAMELDPNFAPAHAALAYALFFAVLHAFGGEPQTLLVAAAAAAERAIVIDPDDPFGYDMSARPRLMSGDYDGSIASSRKALALNPNLASAHFCLGWALAYSGRAEEGIQELDEAIRLSPRDPTRWAFLLIKGQACLFMERYDVALTHVREALREPNAGLWAHVSEAVALAQLDRLDEARQAVNRIKSIKPDFDLSFVEDTTVLVRAVGVERYIEGLRKAGVT